MEAEWSGLVKREQDKQVIVIEPADRNTIQVPYYDPGVIYGEWPYTEYPPYAFAAPGYIAGGVATGLAFGAAYVGAGRWAETIGAGVSVGAGTTST
jgi:hypothetical protein